MRSEKPKKGVDSIEGKTETDCSDGKRKSEPRWRCRERWMPTFLASLVIAIVGFGLFYAGAHGKGQPTMPDLMAEVLPYVGLFVMLLGVVGGTKSLWQLLHGFTLEIEGSWISFGSRFHGSHRFSIRDAKWIYVPEAMDNYSLFALVWHRWIVGDNGLFLHFPEKQEPVRIAPRFSRRRAKGLVRRLTEYLGPIPDYMVFWRYDPTDKTTSLDGVARYLKGGPGLTVGAAPDCTIQLRGFRPVQPWLLEMKYDEQRKDHILWNRSKTGARLTADTGEQEIPPKGTFALSHWGKSGRRTSGSWQLDWPSVSFQFMIVPVEKGILSLQA